jgi:hypothetical protein
MEFLSGYEVITLIAGLIGVYFKLNNDVLKLKSRVMVLEKNDTQVQEMLSSLLEAVNEIKLILAENGIKRQ